MSKDKIDSLALYMNKFRAEASGDTAEVTRLEELIRKAKNRLLMSLIGKGKRVA